MAAPEYREDNDIATDTNDIPNWPICPSVNARAAFLLEANTGVILYAKNAHDRLYPASTTKILTALLAAENSQMDEPVEFSYDAVFSLDPGSSNIGIDPGQILPMEECLYGIMVGSANEVANAVAEYIGGDRASFIDMMNKRVEELGLKDTHFTNPSGLPDKEHYTSAYDLGIIAKEFFNNEKLSKICNTSNHHFVATATQPDDFYVRNKHKLINGDIPYEGIKGGKTGYTVEANETLVTCAERDGMKLVCVVLYDNSPDQFTDTVTLFDYGFSNFQVTNISENEDRYQIKSNNLFPTNVDILGNSKQILELNDSDYIIMPKNITFEDLEREVRFDNINSDEIARIDYSYHNAYLGYGSVKRMTNSKTVSVFDANLSQVKEEETSVKMPPKFINVVNVSIIVISVGIVLILISFVISFLTNYNFLDNIKSKKQLKRRSRRDKGRLKF